MENLQLSYLVPTWNFPFVVGEKHLQSSKERHRSKIWGPSTSDSHEILESIWNAVVQEDTLNKFLVSVAQNPSGPWLQLFIFLKSALFYGGKCSEPLVSIGSSSFFHRFLKQVTVNWMWLLTHKICHVCHFLLCKRLFLSTWKNQPVLLNTWPALFKTVKVIKNRESQRNCHSQEKP